MSLIDKFFSSYIGGVILSFFGVYLIKRYLRDEKKEKRLDAITGNGRTLVSGIAFIVIGIIIFIAKLVGKI
jgi:putative Mn2+ efflux pump MntP